MISAYPGGWPGIGLVLIRAVVALLAGAQGGLLFVTGSHSEVSTLGALAMVAAIAAAIGAFTSLSSAAAAVTVVLAADLRAAEMFATCANAAALMCIGPGAYSLDSRWFGRREIVIPIGSAPDGSQ